MSLDPMVQVLVFRGSLAPDGSVDALREVVEIRRALDLAMADLVVAGTQEDEDVSDLRAMVKGEMVEKAGRGESFLEADKEFFTRRSP